MNDYWKSAVLSSVISREEVFQDRKRGEGEKLDEEGSSDLGGIVEIAREATAGSYPPSVPPSPT